ncbi:MAG: hypothetical protein IPI67_25105 [Myxococcales bacterium]|nr:hypothetical protein [Myxococcales bacterium]
MPSTLRVLLALAVAVGCSPAPAPPALSAPPERAATSAPNPGPTAAPSPPPTASGSAAPPPAPAWEESPLKRLPPEFVTFGESPRLECGKFVLEALTDASSNNEPYVRVTAHNGKPIYQAKGREYSVGRGEPRMRMSLLADWCGDLTGDGVPELLLTERTMGAHCCYTHYVVSLTSPTHRLLMWEKGDGGHGVLPVKLKPGATWQLLSWDIIDPPFSVAAGDPVLSYATTPSFPIVFDLVGGKYQKHTFAFGAALAKRREAERAECRDKPAQCELSELLEWGYGLIIGDWAQEKSAAVPDAELRTRLDVRAAAMKRLLEQRLGR